MADQTWAPPPDVAGLIGAQDEDERKELVLHGTSFAQDSSSESDSDSDSDREPPKDIGDVDPSKCKVSGPGFSGSGAGAPVKLYLYAHDHYGRRITKGGDDVVVRISPASSSAAASAPIEAAVSLAWGCMGRSCNSACSLIMGRRTFLTYL